VLVRVKLVTRPFWSYRRVDAPPFEREKVGSLGPESWSRNFVRINIDREHRVAYGMSDGNRANGTKYPRLDVIHQKGDRDFANSSFKG